MSKKINIGLAPDGEVYIAVSFTTTEFKAIKAGLSCFLSEAGTGEEPGVIEAAENLLNILPTQIKFK